MFSQDNGLTSKDNIEASEENMAASEDGLWGQINLIKEKLVQKTHKITMKNSYLYRVLRNFWTKDPTFVLHFIKD